LALSILLLSLNVYAADAPLDPEKPGPYPVGVTTMILTDEARTDAMTGDPRQLVTEIWYPATDDARGKPKNTLIDFTGGSANSAMAGLLKMAFQVDIAEMNKTFQNIAVRDADARDGVYPLILFSHGNGGLRYQGAFWCEHMASHGYIVMAPDHTGNAAVTVIGSKIVPYLSTDEAREQSAVDRPKDLSFLIGAMESMNKESGNRFAGKVDLEHVGVAGHSFGGYTSTWIADQDARVDAISPWAGVAKTRLNYECPAMVLVGTEDDTMGIGGNERIRAYYDESKGPRYLVEFLNAGHFSFTEMYQFVPDFGDGVGLGKRITNGEPVTYITMDVMFPLVKGYVTAFFGQYLKGLDYSAYLSANRNPAELIVKSSVPKIEKATKP
jgi:dienelactone hydrolase